MSKFFRQLVFRLDSHLSDEHIASLLCGELSLVERLIANRHLAKCRLCRVRREDLEGPRAEQMLDLYREASEAEELLLMPQPREEFLRRLHTQILQAPPQGWWARHRARFAHLALSPRNPVLVLM